MKGKIETTIPQRQYENLKISYEYESEEEKEAFIQTAIEDCVKYHHAVSTKAIDIADSKLPPKAKKLVIDYADEQMKVVTKIELMGIVWRQRKKGRKLVWEFWNETSVPNMWTEGTLTDEKPEE